MVLIPNEFVSYAHTIDNIEQMLEAYKHGLSLLSVPTLRRRFMTVENPRIERGMSSNSDTELPPDLASLDAGTVLYDRDFEHYFVVIEVGPDGIALDHDGTEYTVPRSIFTAWQHARAVPAAEMASQEPPAWVTNRR